MKQQLEQLRKDIEREQEMVRRKRQSFPEADYYRAQYQAYKNVLLLLQVTETSIEVEEAEKREWGTA